MEQKIAIALAALRVAALAAPAVMAATVDYSATVTGGQNTAIDGTPNGAFGSVKTGSILDANVIANSVTLENTGTDEAIVNAKFTTSSSGIYGLTNVSGVIGGSNFTLGNTTWPLLKDTDLNTQLDGVPAGEIKIYKAKLQIPAGQALGSYTGTVQLTFS